jgi:hypothetical protein
MPIICARGRKVPRRQKFCALRLSPDTSLFTKEPRGSTDLSAFSILPAAVSRKGLSRKSRNEKFSVGCVADALNCSERRPFDLCHGGTRCAKSNKEKWPWQDI